MDEYLESLFGQRLTDDAYAEFMSRAEARGVLDQIDDMLKSVPHADLVSTDNA